MANDWIIDVLADLKKYAAKNGLAALARQLDDTTLVAVSEIAATQGGGQELTIGEIGNTGGLYRAVASRNNA